MWARGQFLLAARAALARSTSSGVPGTRPTPLWDRLSVGLVGAAVPRGSLSAAPPCTAAAQPHGVGAWGLAGRGLRSSSSGAAAVGVGAGEAKAAATAAAGAARALAAPRGYSAEWPISRKANYWSTVYKQLSKFRLSGLVVATAAGGYVMGSGEVVEWRGLAALCAGTMAASACANTCNQLIEIKLDALMSRTRARPLPSGRVSPAHAAAFAAIMGASGVALLYTQTNGLTAALGAANIALYAGVYTPLKQLHFLNTWVGALVGAIPPLMGWAAARGTLDPGAALLAGVLHFWQLPHFLALAWMCKDDYAAGGHRMISLRDSTGRRTAACALRNCIYLLPLGLVALGELGVAPRWVPLEGLGVTTAPFAVEATAMATYMGFYALKFYQAPSYASAKALFRSSLFYLPVVMVCMIIHRIPEAGKPRASEWARGAV